MVKFSKGMWHATPDTIIRWATESVKAEALPESIRTVAVCLGLTSWNLYDGSTSLGIPLLFSL